MSLHKLKQKTLDDLEGLERPVVRSMIEDDAGETIGEEGKLVDPDQDTNELEALNEVTNTGALNMGGSKAASSSKIQSTADGIEIDTPREGSSPPRVHIQDGLLLPMNVELDEDVAEEGGEAVKVDQDDLDHIEVIEQGSGLPDRVSRGLGPHTVQIPFTTS